MEKKSFVVIGESIVNAGHAIGAGSATFGLAGAAIGVGVIFGLFVYGITKNPTSEKAAFKYVMLGFALTEAVGLLSIMMSFLILFT
jgi:F0F1-type ATP synthase membrane subunit c/vacuolar-type H+-ATPase subunit K